MDHSEKCQTIKHLPKDEYFLLLTTISGQKAFNSLEHSSYHTTFDLKMSMVKKVSFSPTQADFFNLYLVGKEYDVFHVQIKHIVRYIDENVNQRYLFLPMLYTNAQLGKSHANCCVIDTHKKEIFILEPNGVHPLDFVDKVMDIIVSDIKRRKPGYKFVPLYNWLLSKRSLNCWNDADGLGSGICATICLFLAHKLIQVQEKEELDLYLKSLTRDKAKSDIKSFIETM